jgi:hypothetical protein
MSTRTDERSTTGAASRGGRVLARLALLAWAVGALGCGGARPPEEVSEAWTAGDEEALGVAPEPTPAGPAPESPASGEPAASEPAPH